MAFYGDLTPVESFLYRKILVEIFRAVRGGHCEKCDLHLEHEERTCPNCGDEIFPSKVYPIKVSGNLLGLDGDTHEDARERAKEFIDDVLDGKEDKDPGIDIEDPWPPKKGRKGGKNRKGQAANRAGAKGGSAKLVDQVRGMGWGKRALAILRGS